MTPEEQIDFAAELWAIAQAPTTEIGIEGVTQLMIPVIVAYTAAVEAKERERIAEWIRAQRNDVPATGEEFAAAIRSL